MGKKGFWVNAGIFAGCVLLWGAAFTAEAVRGRDRGHGTMRIVGNGSFAVAATATVIAASRQMMGRRIETIEHGILKAYEAAHWTDSPPKLTVHSGGRDSGRG